MKHFSDKCWMVLYEQSGGGFGCRQYGIVAICNKPKEADDILAKYNEASRNNSRIEYKIKEVPLSGNTQLFEFLY